MNPKFDKVLRKLRENDEGIGGVSLGETSGTAYRGDRGKTAYDHSQVAHAPSDATAPVAITSGTRNIVAADNGKLFTNAGATEDIILSLDSVADLGNAFEIEVVNEVGAGGIDSYTKLMLHFNNNATDSSSSNHTPTATNMTYTNTAGEFKFGYAGVFNGTSSVITYPDSDDWDLGSNDFTISVWLKRNGNQSYGRIIDCGYIGTEGWVLNFGGPADSYNCVRLEAKTSSYASILNSTSALVDLTWTHVALIRSGNVLTFYLNGVADAVANVTGLSFHDYGNGLHVGSAGSGDFFNGSMDELKFEKGIARSISELYPQTSEYYSGSRLTVTPDAADQLPGTAAAGSSIKSEPKGAYIKLRSTDDGWICTGVYPAAENWVDQLD